MEIRKKERRREEGGEGEIYIKEIGIEEKAAGKGREKE